MDEEKLEGLNFDALREEAKERKIKTIVGEEFKFGKPLSYTARYTNQLAASARVNFLNGLVLAIACIYFIIMIFTMGAENIFRNGSWYVLIPVILVIIACIVLGLSSYFGRMDAECSLSVVNGHFAKAFERRKASFMAHLLSFAVSGILNDSRASNAIRSMNSIAQSYLESTIFGLKMQGIEEEFSKVKEMDSVFEKNYKIKSLHTWNLIIPYVVGAIAGIYLFAFRLYVEKAYNLNMELETALRLIALVPLFLFLGLFIFNIIYYSLEINYWVNVSEKMVSIQKRLDKEATEKMKEEKNEEN